MKTLLLLASLLLLSGCFHATIPAQTDTLELTYIHPSAPAEMTLREVKWRVFNREELLKYLEENKDVEIALFAIETKDYENLALNMQEIIRYVREQKEIIIYYRETLPDPTKGGDSEEK
jgi:hypothetical protein